MCPVAVDTVTGELFYLLYIHGECGVRYISLVLVSIMAVCALLLRFMVVLTEVRAEEVGELGLYLVELKT